MLNLQSEEFAQTPTLPPPLYGVDPNKDPCDTGFVGKIKEFAPACVDACTHSCSALENALQTYMFRGGQPAMMPVLCHYTEQYACAVSTSNLPNCVKLIDQARALGVMLPESTSELQ